jgi:hypothetical protein
MAVAFLEFTATRIADSSSRNAVGISSANNLTFSAAAVRVRNPDRPPRWNQSLRRRVNSNGLC